MCMNMWESSRFHFTTMMHYQDHLSVKKWLFPRAVKDQGTFLTFSRSSEAA